MNKEMNHVAIKKPPYLMILIIMMGSLIALLNNSLLNNALPTIMKDFHIKDYSTVQWLSTGYMLIVGVLIPASAFLITRFKNRYLFIITMSIFTVGTFMAAVAPSFGFLLAGRLIQAVGASVLSPLLMNIMLASFPPEKRGFAMGIYGLISTSGPALGPTISGLILQHYSWRYLFIMIAPLAVINVIIATWKLDSILKTKESHLDYISIILSTIGFGGVLYGFSSASSNGWGNISVYGPIGVGLVSLIIFVIRQLHLEEPLLDLRAYKHPIFALGSGIQVFLSATLYSGMLLLPIYMQSVRGFAPLKSGLILLPGVLVMAIMSPITGKLYDMFGARILVLIGLAITGVTTYFFSKLQIDTTTSYIVMVSTIQYFGISMIMMPVISNSLTQLPRRLHPHGSAINSTVQQVSGSLGCAIFITLMTNHAKTQGAEIAATAKATAVKMTQQQISQMALLDAIRFTFGVTIFIILCAFVLSMFFKRARVEGQETESESKNNSSEKTA